MCDGVAHSARRPRRAIVLGHSPVFVNDTRVPTSQELTRRARSAIVFVSTRYSAQLLMETLTELGLHCVALHSAMSQRRRLAALGKFKSTVCKVRTGGANAESGSAAPNCG